MNIWSKQCSFLHSTVLDDFVLSMFKAVLLVFSVSCFVVVRKASRRSPPVFCNKQYEGFQLC